MSMNIQYDSIYPCCSCVTHFMFLTNYQTLSVCVKVVCFPFFLVSEVNLWRYSGWKVDGPAANKPENWNDLSLSSIPIGLKCPHPWEYSEFERKSSARMQESSALALHIFLQNQGACRGNPSFLATQVLSWS